MRHQKQEYLTLPGEILNIAELTGRVYMQRGKIFMKKRTAVRITAFSLAVLGAIIGLFVQMNTAVSNYRLETENVYSAALADFGAALENISQTGEKIGYVNTPYKLSGLSSKLYCEAELAKSALSRLPVSGDEYSQINLFLSQVGNYALSVSNDLRRSGRVSPEQSESFLSLADTARKISSAVSDWDAVNVSPKRWAREVKNTVKEDTSQTLRSTLSETEETLTDYAKLIYDGPYSEHILDKSPVLLQNAQTVSESAAKEKAAEALPGTGEPESRGKSGGRLPQFCFERGGATASVSEKGGYLVYLRSGREIGESRLGYEGALENAKRFISGQLGADMRETYYFMLDGVCVINFAFADGDILCYTDLVKVGIALDNGETVMYEASGYIFNHTERDFTAPLKTSEQARERLSGMLTVNSESTVLIPTDGGGESLCYEFNCTGRNGREILVYINAETLEEEQIYILLRADGGVLVR